MVIQDLKKTKDKYVILIDNQEYHFNEETILKYRLVKGKNIADSILSDAIIYDEIMTHYSKALSYALKYQRTQRQMYDYLSGKNLSNHAIAEIIDKLVSVDAINDRKLIVGIIDSLIRKSNGILLIEHKLYEHKFSKELIDESLKKIDYNLYLQYLTKLFDKTKDKYKDNDMYIKNIKIKKYLLSRGYTYSDIDNISKLG